MVDEINFFFVFFNLSAKIRIEVVYLTHCIVNIVENIWSLMFFYWILGILSRLLGSRHLSYLSGFRYGILNILSRLLSGSRYFPFMALRSFLFLWYFFHLILYWHRTLYIFLRIAIKSHLFFRWGIFNFSAAPTAAPAAPTFLQYKCYYFIN